MSIRRKTLLITLVAVAGAAVVMGATSRLILARGFARLEAVLVKRSVDRVRFAIEDEIDTIAATASDWAYWDDTHRFVQDRNAEYAKSNLTDSSLDNVGLDFMLFVRSSGEVVHAAFLGREGVASAASVTWGSEEQLRPLLAKCLRRKPVKGLVSTPRGVVLLAAYPILPSDQLGPPAGMLAIGRHLQPADMDDIARRTITTVSMRRLGANLPDDFAKAWSDLEGNSAEVVVQPVDSDAIAGYALLDDIHGRPALMLQTQVPREAQQKARTVSAYLLIALMLAMAVFGFSVNWMLRRVVTDRLSSLTEGLQDIASRQDASARVAVEGSDELGALATTLNMMLAAIEQSQAAIRENEARLRLVIDSVQTGILIVDAETHEIVEVNSTALEMIGASRQEVVGSICHKHVCPSERGRCPITDLGVAVDSSERVLLRHDGEALPVLKRAVEVTLDGRRCVLESFLDITSRKKAEEAIRYQAYHDSLTGLPNRMHFQQRLTDALVAAREASSKVAVLMLDLDRFKTINDTLGHSAGDALLQSVATRLAGCLRSRDSVARLGGDEFAVLLTEVQDVEGTARVARRILEALRPPFAIDGIDLHTTASIGISVFPRDGDAADGIIQNADVALYHAKDQGRDTFRHYASWINSGARAKLTLENDLRGAVARQEFVVHYQPQINVPTGRIVGLEALVRWQHPDLGLLLPGEFISLAEETGLMESIGEWVLRQSVEQSLAWQRQGLRPVKVAVNLSPVQFRHQRLSEVVKGLISETGLDPSLLELEITESAVMSNVNTAIKLMDKLNATGIRLCMDDFGVGQTSLMHLKQFPIDTVKIDGSFLRTVEANPTDAAIVSAIIGIGDTLDLLVVGEGVETESQSRFLLDRGCETMQGFLFSQPLTADAATDLLREGRVDPLPAALA